MHRRLLYLAMVGAMVFQNSQGIIRQDKPLEPPPRIVSNLVVNNSTDYINVVEKNEEEGVRDLRQLAENSQLEESWVYLPLETLWVEIGKTSFPLEIIVKNKEIIGYQERVENYTGIVFKLMQAHWTLVHYHIHIKKSGVVKEGIDYIVDGLKISDSSLLEIENLVSSATALPSALDIRNMVVHSDAYYTLNSRGQISHKVVSGYGVTEYTVTEEGRRFFSGRDVPFVDKYTEGLYSKAEGLKLPSLRTFGSLEGTISWIHQLKGALSDENIQVTFHPYAK